MNNAKNMSGWMCSRDMPGTKQRMAPAPTSSSVTGTSDEAGEHADERYDQQQRKRDLEGLHRDTSP